jgi:hypothetical protein
MKPAIEKGEKCYNARLTAEQVHEARILVMKGPIGTCRKLLGDGVLRSKRFAMP